MDYEPDNISHRDEVLSQFRESLSRPLSDRYYDEDELLEIFDYAGDIGDDYLRIEALMCAARYYPDSEQFGQRKAIFYAQYSDDAGDKYIDDNSSASGMIWDIMRAHRAAPVDDKSKVDVLNSIIDTYDELTDEEVIQFVDLVLSYGQMKWLKDNMPKLRSKVMYINILLYEVAVAAEESREVALAAQMLEELTELEPFNFFFWLMLAKEYESLNQGEKALSAVDYALALNPEDTQSLFTKAKILLSNDKDINEVINLLKAVIKLKPDYTDAVRTLAYVYYDTSRVNEAVTLLQEHLDNYPQASTEIVPELIKFRPANVSELLDKFYANNEDNNQLIWMTWAHHLAQSGFMDLGREILQAYERNSGVRIYSQFTLEDLFTKQQFGEMIMLLSEYITNSDNQDFYLPSVVTMHLVSMIKLGEFDHAEKFCEFIESHITINHYSDITNRLLYLGMLSIVNNVKQKLKETKNPADWRDFDPLKLWNVK